MQGPGQVARGEVGGIRAGIQQADRGEQGMEFMGGDQRHPDSMKRPTGTVTLKPEA